MKVIAFYLPQFHQNDMNDKWWGEGFTEWSNMKKAEPLFEGHYQPRVPLGENYYNLLDSEVMKWQIDLAKRHGLYGFCVYHYWSEQGMLLEKPMEAFLENKDLDFPFCFCWANENWTNAWATDSRNPKVLWKQTYGDEREWKRHFDYLLRFLKDERYIKVEGMPLFVIYRPEQIPNLNEMLDYWNILAAEHGLKGFAYASQQKDFHFDGCDDSRFSYKIEYQPDFAQRDLISRKDRIINRIKEKIILNTEKLTGKSIPKMQKLQVKNYDTIWEAILKRQPESEKMIPGAFVDWDNTPRYGRRSVVFSGASPDKFYCYMKQQIVHARDVYKKDMLFLFAWNEWSEGGYLEPDEKYGYEYLEGLKKALLETENEKNEIKIKTYKEIC